MLTEEAWGPGLDPKNPLWKEKNRLCELLSVHMCSVTGGCLHVQTLINNFGKKMLGCQPFRAYWGEDQCSRREI